MSDISPQPLSSFNSQIRNTNIARPYLFFAIITLPPDLVQFSSKFDTNKLSLYCHGAQTPMINFMTNDNYFEAGVRRKYVYDYDYQDLMLQFYVDQDYSTFKFFDKWREIITKNRRNLSFPDSYTAETLNLYMIDLKGIVKHSYSFKRVVPKIINSISLDYATNGIMSLPVSFVFESIENGPIPANTSITDQVITDKQSASLENKELQQMFEQFQSGGGGDFGGGGATGSW
jgi:hypothetical protein